MGAKHFKPKNNFSKPAQMRIPAGAKPFKITNLSTSKSAFARLEICDTSSSRTRGLMFRKKCIPLLFEFEEDGIYPIHSFFVAFSFDAIYLSKNYEAIHIFREVKPFTPYLANSEPAKFLLELPCNFPLKINEGDKLQIT